VHCTPFLRHIVFFNDEYAFDFAVHFPFRGLLLCLMVMTVNPVIITSENPGQEGCIVGGELTFVFCYEIA
jgi:hypothetical protein